MANIKEKTLRFYFNGSRSIDESFSQAGQDLFVLSVLNGKRNGTYLEIGAGPAQDGSNTFLLENYFGWSGIGIELDPGLCKNQKDYRKTFIENSDATTIDYEDLFIRAKHNSNEFDYLSLDLDGDCTLQALYKLPLEKYKFATVTYEHDYYVYSDLGNANYEKYKRLSREYLQNFGYKLIFPNVAFPWLDHKGVDSIHEFEDWWVHPDLVDMDRVKFMIRKNETKNLWGDYIFTNL